MGLFKKRQEKPKDKRVVLGSLNAERLSFVKERGRKVAATKFSRYFKVGIFVLIVGLVLIGGLALFASIAYSLKTGGKVTIGSQIQQLISKTPLKYIVKVDTQVEEQQFVVGLIGVPAFPQSSFVFEDYIVHVGKDGFAIQNQKFTGDDAQELYSFLTSGQSTYRLPLNTTWEQVKTYYDAELTKLGWKQEGSVTVFDTEKIQGEYYSKDNKGLHIYPVASDIWYETVTKEQAAQGLHDKIVAFKAKQELVQAASGKDLPLDADWKMRYSRDWDIELQRNTIYGVNNIYFTNSKSKEHLSIAVINRYRGNIADVDYKYLESSGIGYISTWLTTQQTTVSLQGFTRTERVVASGKAMEFSDLKNHANFLFLVNRKNTMLYVVQYIGKENPEFFEYIKTNLKN